MIQDDFYDTFSYPVYQQQQHNNMMETNDMWQSFASDSNVNSQPLCYYSSSFDVHNSNRDESTDTRHFNHQTSLDPSTIDQIDSNSYISANNYPSNEYFTQSEYHSIDSSQHLYPTYAAADIPIPTISVSTDMSLDYQSTLASWNFDIKNTYKHDVTTTSNFDKQKPCFVCREESFGYDFGAYTCESCKAFCRPMIEGTDPNIASKHSSQNPLSDITKSYRKDCRACCKTKCGRVGMTNTSKDRVLQRKATSKSSVIPIHNLLEQLAHDLTYHQLFTSSTLENLLHILDLPSNIPINFDYHSLYMYAIHIWRNQHTNHSEIFTNILLHDSFAVLLFLFYSLMMTKENYSTINMQVDKLVNILQQEINRITGIDHRLSCRIKALFMKCYVTLAQYFSNSTRISNRNLTEYNQ